MKNISLAIGLILLSVSASSQDASTWSLRFLARSSNVLLVAQDQLLEQKPALCELQSDQIQSLSQNLKALIDEKILRLSKSQWDVIRELAPRCLEECSCDILSYTLEKHTSSENQKALQRIPQEASRIDFESRLKCARNFPEFCKSRLMKKISR